MTVTVEIISKAIRVVELNPGDAFYYPEKDCYGIRSFDLVIPGACKLVPVVLFWKTGNLSTLPITESASVTPVDEVKVSFKVV
jgi:hypothetical protein